jgi:hypothetical protein
MRRQIKNAKYKSKNAERKPEKNFLPMPQEPGGRVDPAQGFLLM